MKVVLLSFHVFTSERRAGFHFIAEEMARRENDVYFITVGVSPLSLVRNADHHADALAHGINHWRCVETSNVNSYVLYTPYHPVNLRNRLLNQLTETVFYNYGQCVQRLRSVVDNANVVIFESALGLLFIPWLEKKPHAKWIYRVSDDLPFLKPHPVMIDAECEALKLDLFDLVSCPSEPIFTRLQQFSRRVRLQQHGIDMSSYDACHTSPYKGQSDFVRANAVFVGMSHVDVQALEIMAKQNPDVLFHLIGKIKFSNNLNNVMVYGVLPFSDTVPFVKYADVGLQTRISKGDSGLRHSLKVQQYTYVGLPIVGPQSLDTGWGNYFGFPDEYSEDDVSGALRKALMSGRNDSARTHVRSWADLVNDMHNCL